MGKYKNTDEVLHDYIDKLGYELGKLYHSLLKEITWLHIKWQEYRELYGTSSKRVDLLNSAAPLFFRITQDVLWEDLLLSLARLTDPPISCGKENLTIKAIPKLISDASFRKVIASLVSEADVGVSFARDWRNKHIAHRDAKIALGVELEPLSPTSRQMVGNAIKAIDKVMNTVSEKYLNRTIMFDLIHHSNGAVSLLYVVRDGLDVETKRRERLASGNFSKDDFASKEPI